MEGWITLDRKILDWDYIDNPNTFALFIQLLLRANHEDGNWKGLLVKRGQLVTSVAKLSTFTGLTIRQVRYALEKLVKCQTICQTHTNNFTIITICNYDSYQRRDSDYTKSSGKQNVTQIVTPGVTPVGNKQQNNNITNIKETSPKGESKKSISLSLSKEDILKKFYEEQEKFKKELQPYLEIYGRDILNDFFLYWTEPNKSGTKMRFQYEKTWDTKRRLNTWANKPFNKSNSNSNGNGKYQRPTKEERDAAIADLLARKLAAIGSNQELQEP